MDSSNRNISFDIIRVVACFFIICNHSPLPAEDGSGLFLSALSYLTVTGISLFFMISGGLLLPMKGSVSGFLKKRLSKILSPALLWSIFYLSINQTLNSNVNWYKSIVSLPFSAQGTSVFWFIYTLIGLYLLVPILSRWLKACTKGEMEFYLAIWGISMCYPIIKNFVDINTTQTGILYYFSGFVGYFVLGYYLKIYLSSIKWRYLTPLTVISLIAPIACKLFHWEVDFYEVFWFYSIFVAILSVFIYKSIISIFGKKHISQHTSNIITKLSNLTFGIYLVHIFVMRYLIWKWDFIMNIQSYYTQTLVIILLTCLGSSVLCYLISLLPGAKYIIGYQNK